jgi:hypothetical protein
MFVEFLSVAPEHEFPLDVMGYGAGRNRTAFSRLKGRISGGTPRTVGDPAQFGCDAVEHVVRHIADGDSVIVERDFYSLDRGALALG